MHFRNKRSINRIAKIFDDVLKDTFACLPIKSKKMAHIQLNNDMPGIIVYLTLVLKQEKL
jgi:hypothetical protein